MEPKGGKFRFLPDTIKRATTYARFPVSIPSAHQLSLTGHVQTHEKIFELHIATTDVPYMIRLTYIERLLFDTILLHKLMKHFDHENANDREDRSRVVLGCMIQHRMTKLLIDVHPQELKEIYLLGHAGEIDRHTWETSFVGAASCARTICTFLEINQGRVFLPSVFEDCMLGIDLIILNSKRDNWCVSVKAGRPNTPMTIEHVHTRPDDRRSSHKSENRRRIFDGAHGMEELYDETFRACRIIVGKTNGNPYDLTVYPEDVDHLQRFIEKDRARPFTQHTITNEKIETTNTT